VRLVLFDFENNTGAIYNGRLCIQRFTSPDSSLRLVDPKNLRDLLVPGAMLPHADDPKDAA
jgi:hypothetical protein